MANILIIDDDAVLLKLYSTRLSADGHQVVAAPNGDEALNAISQTKPDVIILDLLMPKMNGFEFLKQLKARPDVDQVPIIVFSSVASKEQLERLNQLDVAKHLNKIDTTPTQLVTVINQYIQSPT